MPNTQDNLTFFFITCFWAQLITYSFVTEAPSLADEPGILFLGPICHVQHKDIVDMSGTRIYDYTNPVKYELCPYLICIYKENVSASSYVVMLEYIALAILK